MHAKVLFSILCFVGLSSALYADEVYLKNGDRLTGQIVRMTDGKLIFLSQAAGEVTVNLTDIRTFSSVEPVEVRLKDGTVLHQSVGAAEPNQLALKGAAPSERQKVPLAELAAINPPPPAKPKWTGSVSGAFGVTTGNTETSTITASASASRRSERDRITAEGDIAKSRSKDPDTGSNRTTEDWWRIRGEYDYFFSKKLFGFVNGRYEQDSVALLDRRALFGAGAGYQWIETPQTAFSTNIGVADLFEKYENQPATDNKLSLQAGYNFTQQLGKNVKFLHDLTWYPRFEDFGDFFLTSTAEVRANLTKTMFANFKVIFNYDETPALGREKADVKYLLGVGLNF